MQFSRQDPFGIDRLGFPGLGDGAAEHVAWGSLDGRRCLVRVVARARRPGGRRFACALMDPGADCPPLTLAPRDRGDAAPLPEVEPGGGGVQPGVRRWPAPGPPVRDGLLRRAPHGVAHGRAGRRRCRSRPGAATSCAGPRTFGGSRASGSTLAFRHGRPRRGTGARAGPRRRPELTRGPRVARVAVAGHAGPADPRIRAEPAEAGVRHIYETSATSEQGCHQRASAQVSAVAKREEPSCRKARCHSPASTRCCSRATPRSPRGSPDSSAATWPSTSARPTPSSTCAAAGSS